MHIRARTKKKRARARKRPCLTVRTHIYASCAHVFTRNFTKTVLIVHYYVMTLSLKFHKDPSFCWGDMRKIMLNMHAIGIYKCSKFWYTFVHVFALCAHICAQIFTKFFLVVHYTIISLSFKFHKDPIFHCWDIWKKLWVAFFLATTVFMATILDNLKQLSLTILCNYLRLSETILS